MTPLGGTPNWGTTPSDLCRSLGAAGLSVLVATFDYPPERSDENPRQLLVLTTASDEAKARAVLTAAGFEHLLAPLWPRSPDDASEVHRPPGLVASPQGEPGGLADESNDLSAPAGAAAATPLTALTAHSLSPREVQVLRLFANGALHGQVARELYVSPKTVKNHLAHIYTKLGVANRTQAVALAVKKGLVTIG
jgi:DNA-binding CsgD family transcriptional regulator